MQTPDVTVRLQALDGTWEVCGADRAIGVVPESVVLTANDWGPDKASFDLHRSPLAIWPDLSSFAPVEVEIGGVVVWRGRTGETPIKDGAERVISVQCAGMQYHLDDDTFERVYVHAGLTDWKDMRSPLGADLTTCTSAPQVQAGSGALVLTWPQGQATNGRAGVLLDLGPSTLAERVVIDWSLTAGAANRVIYFGWGSTPNGIDEANIIYGAVGASSGTYAATLTTPSRYVYILHDANSHTPGADETLKITRALVFADTAYESGNASVLAASTVVVDALERGTMLLSDDHSQIQATSFAIPDLPIAKPTTPREVIEAVNAYHNWVTKLDLSDRMVFAPRPTAPLLEIGSWPGAESEDASANDGSEIYNRVIVDATSADGARLVVERTAGQQPNVPYMGISSPAPDNPTFATNTTSWSASSGSITRDTSTFRSSPASGRWEVAGEVGHTLTETFTGTFEKGTTYRLTFSLKGDTATNLLATLGTATDSSSVLFSSSEAFSTITISWTPKKDVSGAMLKLTTMPSD